jgi:hypothetical protein
MVGERYRDLLSSSEALGTLFDASARLSTGLGRMRELVGSVNAGDLGVTGSGASVDGAASDKGVGEGASRRGASCVRSVRLELIPTRYLSPLQNSPSSYRSLRRPNSCSTHQS